MMKRAALLAAAGLLATACASNPAPSTGMTTTSGAVPLTPSAGTVTEANFAASTHWVAEERLMPDDPMLAMVSSASKDTENPMGAAMTCNAANGAISFHLGKQPAARIGQSATWRLRTGASARDLDGKFVANRKTGDADFVFSFASADLMAMAQLDMVSFIGDQGDVQWAFVKDPAAKAPAKYVGSLAALGVAARDFLTFCNPK